MIKQLLKKTHTEQSQNNHILTLFRISSSIKFHLTEFIVIPK